MGVSASPGSGAGCADAHPTSKKIVHAVATRLMSVIWFRPDFIIPLLSGIARFSGSL
jgi:hypothetical protein